MNNMIDVDRICMKTNNKYKIYYKKCVTSTNEILMMNAKTEDHGTVLIVDEQTAGKGRKGRSFFSPADSGIYMSILLKPTFSTDETTLLTPMTATVVAQSIEELFGLRCDIKWVNDVLVGDKKVCGILTEASFSAAANRFEYVVVGIGINITPPKDGFPADIEDIAGSVSKTLPDKNGLIIEILNRFYESYNSISERNFYDAYKERSRFLGKEIRILNRQGEETVTAVDITEDFHLLVRDKKGVLRELNSGEISIRL